MHAIKRLEIVTTALALPEVTRLLDALAIPGYTIISGVTGKGRRGRVTDDELTGVARNTYVIVACEADLAQRAVAALQPVLAAYGGLFLMSDVVRVS